MEVQKTSLSEFFALATTIGFRALLKETLKAVYPVPVLL